MSDLSQSQTASLVLNPGDTYRISTGGTATVKAIYGAPAGTTTITANFATFGPYDAPAKLDVTAVSGTASYSLLAAIPVTKVDGKFSDPALQALVSGDGNRNSAVILGDSWGQYNYRPTVPTSIVDNGDGTATITGVSLKIYTGDPIAIGGMATPRLNQLQATVLSHVLTGANVTSATYSTAGLFVNQAQSGGPFLYVPWQESDNGYFHLGCHLAGVAPDLLANFGSGGADSEQLELLVPEIIKLRPKACFIQCGTNNVYARQWPASRTIASLKRIVDALVVGGVTPVLGAIPGRSNGDQSAANAARTAPVNAWAAKYLPMRGGHFVQHWAASAGGVALADPTSAIALAGANMLSDGVHPGRPYAFGYGKALVAPLRAIFPRVPALTPADIAANGKLWGDNPMLTGTSGTLSAGGGTAAAVPAWAATTVYTAGQPVITGTRLYVAAVGGTSSGSAPTHTSGQAADGTVTWLYVASGVVGGVPTGLAVTNIAGTQSVLACIVPRTEAVDGDAAGNKLRLFITSATSTSNVLVRMAATPAGWDHSDRMAARCGFQASASGTPGSGAPVAMTTPQLKLNCTTATTGGDDSYGPVVQTPGIQIDEGYAMLLRSPPRAPKSAGSAVHGALSFLRLDLDLFFRAAGSATVDIWQPCIEVIDATVLA